MHNNELAGLHILLGGGGGVLSLGGRGCTIEGLGDSTGWGVVGGGIWGGGYRGVGEGEERANKFVFIYGMGNLF
jgi:hypothetical protein